MSMRILLVIIFWMKSLKEKNKKKLEILNKIPIFLAQTYRIVDNPEYADTISWTPDGQSFIIKDVADLTNNIFPKHFKHSNFASFVRQLNMYGFHKERSNEGGQIFKHEYFQKDSVELLPFIKRKGGQSGESEKSCEIMPSNNIVALPSSKQKEFEGELNQLSEKHDGLQNLVSMLVEQNKEIIMQNKSFLNKLVKIDESYRKKLETLIFLIVLSRKNSDGNIIIPHQVHSMLKSFRNSKKEKKKSTATEENNLNALEVFKKETTPNRYQNKNIEEVLEMLKNESEADNSEDDHNEDEQPDLTKSKEKNQQNSFSFDHEFDIGEIPPSPRGSLRSFSINENNDLKDFLDRLDDSHQNIL